MMDKRVSGRSSVFISYAHADAKDVAERLKQELWRKDRDVWLDISRLVPGAGWSREIEQALDRSEVVILLLSRASYVSDICRGEQLRALRKGKRVVPILVQEDAEIPIFLESKQYLSVARLGGEDAINAIVDSINPDTQAALRADYRQTYVTAPRLPSYLLPRPVQMERVCRSLISENESSSIGIVVLGGMGGVGKTLIAQMLCHNDSVQAAFHDGVIWVTVGHDTYDMLPKIREIGRALRDDVKNYDTPEAASNQLRTTLRNKSALIVVDDVWDITQVEPILADAPRSRLLMTSRSQAVAYALRANLIRLDVLSDNEALELLARVANVPVIGMPKESMDIVRECGNLPLAISMIGGLIYSGTANGRDNVWKLALARMQSAELDQIRFPLEHYPYPELQRAISVSLDDLDDIARERYLSLSVFREDEPIPESGLQTIWDTTPIETQTVVDAWVDASLAQRDEKGRITVHDLQLDYVRAMSREKIPRLHGSIVDRYLQRASGGWSVELDDGYVFRNLCFHMAHANRWRDLAATLLDPSYVRAKVRRVGCTSLGDDFQWTEQCLEVLSNAEDRDLFRDLNRAALELRHFVNRALQLRQVDNWLDSELQHLFIIGPPGTGKTMFAQYLWVQWFRESVFVRLARAQGFTATDREIYNRVGSWLAARLDQPFLPRDVFAEAEFMPLLVHLAAVYGKALIVIVDGVDEADIAPFSLTQFLAVPPNIRFVWSGRECSAIIELMQRTGGRGVRLDDFDARDADDLFRSIFSSLKGNTEMTPQMRSQLLEQSRGNPLYLRLAAAQIAEGLTWDPIASPAGIGAHYERDYRKFLKQELPIELVTELVDSIIQTGEARWSELRNVDKNMQGRTLAALRSSPLFQVDDVDDDIVVSAFHTSFRDFLRSRRDVETES